MRGTLVTIALAGVLLLPVSGLTMADEHGQGHGHGNNKHDQGKGKHGQGKSNGYYDSDVMGLV